jgi:hypothetical protein
LTIRDNLAGFLKSGTQEMSKPSEDIESGTQESRKRVIGAGLAPHAVGFLNPRVPD